MSIAYLVDRMVAAGMSAGVAGDIAAAIYAAGAASVPVDTRSAGAKHTAAWRERERLKAEEAAAAKHLAESQNLTKPHTGETSQNLTEPLKTSQSEVSQNPPISTSKISKESKRQNRGARIAADWSPSDAERSFAKQEGFSDFEIGREINKFRDYWTACAGAKGVKLDWSATWRQWIRSGAERAGKTPPPNPNGPDAAGYYAKPDSEQLAAWDAFNERSTGKRLPRDRNQGWRVKSEWPPGYNPTPTKPEGLRHE